jgi:hypothetical protein
MVGLLRLWAFVETVTDFNFLDGLVFSLFWLRLLWRAGFGPARRHQQLL